jgi:hypothetical protein
LHTQAIAETWATNYVSGFFKTSSLVFTSEWLVKNTKVSAVIYENKVCPNSVTAFFSNPVGQTGGKPSANFANNEVGDVTGTNLVLPELLSGKKTITSEILYGDCDICSDSSGNYTNDGQLWYLFLDAATDAGYTSSCASNDPLCIIASIKEYLIWAVEPNNEFTVRKLQVNGFDSTLEAYQDLDTPRDGDAETLVAYVEFRNCTPTGTGAGTDYGIEIPSGTVYSCTNTYAWQYGETGPYPTAGFCGAN